jgi:beta-galactosidase GanA
MGLNTVLVPVCWELIEPEEGRFDFELLRGTLREARRHHLRLVLLWFGSWKNSMSSYVPGWVKRDSQRFPRAELRDGKATESLSAFAPANLDADRRAFAALMRELRKFDAREHTVLMVQVENEIGMVPEGVDSSALAKHASKDNVPADLVALLRARPDAVPSDVAAVWRKAGSPTTGTWRELFGNSASAEELFMAWHYARYVDEVAKAGKAEYPLPLYVNAALNRKAQLPGQYPSGGPVPHLIDVWKAGAPNIDIVTPDVYFGRLDEWSAIYKRRDNPLFVPEIKNDEAVAMHALFAFGQGALGFSPFDIEHTSDPQAKELSRAYSFIAGLGALANNPTVGVLVDGERPTQKFALGGYPLEVNHDYTFSWAILAGGKVVPWPKAGGMIISLGADEFLVMGNGFIVTFAPEDGKGQLGLERVDVGEVEKGRFRVLRRLNGDETHQGRQVRLPLGSFAAQRVKVYRY